jgi:predicted ABC-type ATPase/DNA-binding NarL/FixJ family response regulator
MADALEMLAEARRRREDEEERQRAAGNITAPGPSPDEAARAQRDAADLGIDHAGDDALTRRLAAGARAQRMLTASPRLQQFLADPKNAAIARDDVGPLTFWEQLHRDVDHVRERGVGGIFSDVFSRYTDAYHRGQLNIEEARLANRLNPRTARAYDDRGPLNRRERSRFSALQQRQQFPSSGLFETVAEQLPQIFGAFDSGGHRAVSRARDAWREVMGEDKPLTARRAVGVAATAPIATLGAGAAGVGGFVGGVIGFTYEQEAGAAFEEYRQFVDQQGNRLDPNIAGDYARRVGQINAAIEFVGLATALKAVGVTDVLEDVASRIASKEIRGALRRRGYMEIAHDFSLHLAGGALSEGMTELSQEGVTVALGNFARDAQGGDWKRLSPEEIASRLWESFRVGAEVGGVLGAVPAGLHAGLRIHDVQTARAQQALFQALGDAADASKLRTRSPPAFRAAIDAMMRGGPLEDVRIDADRFVNFFQDRGEDPYAAADRLEGVGAGRLREAVSAGGEVTIPMGTYASEIVGTSAHEGLAAHARLGPGEMTQAEVDARLRLGVDLERAVQESARLQAEAQDSIASDENVQQRIEDMLSRADAYVPSANNRFAKFFTEAIKTMAARANMRPESLLDAVGLDIVGPFSATPKAGEFNQRGEGDFRGQEAFNDPRLRDTENKAVEMARNNFSNAEIADEMGIDARSVSVYLSRAKKKAPDIDIPQQRGGTAPGFRGRYKTYTLEELAALRDKLRASGVTRGINTVIAERTGLTPSNVNVRLWNYDKQQRESPLSATALRFGTASQARALQRRIEAGASADEILLSPLFAAVQRHADQTADTATYEQLSDPAFIEGRAYVDPRSGEQLAFYQAVDRLRADYQTLSGGPVKKERRAVIVMGHPGAGKSTFIRNLADAWNAAFADGDASKAYIPDYEDGYNSEAVHYESAMLRMEALRTLLDDGANIMIERVGDKADTLLAQAETLQERGYTVSLLHIDVNPDEAVRRMARRFLETGRYIVPDSYRSMMGKPKAAFTDVLEQYPWAGYAEIDANGKPEDAKITRSGGAEAAEIARSALERRSVPGSAGSPGVGAGGVQTPSAGEFFQGGPQLSDKELDALGFYSAASEAVRASKTARAPGSQWWATIKKTPGVKQEELQWMGLEDWLKAQDGPVTREAVLDFIRSNGVRVEETVLGDRGGLSSEQQAALLSRIEERDRLLAEREFLAPSNARRMAEIAARVAKLATEISQLDRLRDEGKYSDTQTRWSEYTLPGGENYRELLLRLPEQELEALNAEHQRLQDEFDSLADRQGIRAREIVARLKEIDAEAAPRSQNQFQSSHFDQPNILAHVRFNERVDAQGRRTLFMEEVQSDWHQAGRERGYVRQSEAAPSTEAEARAYLDQQGVSHSEAIAETRIPAEADLIEAARALHRVRNGERYRAVPDAPFKNNAWAALAMKRMIRWAAENGFEQIAWTRGQHQVERFSLAQHFSRLRLVDAEDGSRHFIAIRNDGGPRMDEPNMTEARLADLIGRDAAQKLWDAPVDDDGYRTLDTEGVEIGGEGMRAFYDRILPNIANDLGKKFGARVNQTPIDTRTVPYLSGDRWLIADETRGGRIEGTPEFQSQEAAQAWIEKNKDTVHFLPITQEMREQALQGLPLFQTGPNAGPRGSVAFSRDQAGRINNAVIKLYEARNLSTLMHEGGHVFLEMLAGLAADPNASEQLRGDWATVLDWFGIDEARWREMTQMPEAQAVEALRPYHERWARMFEAYLYDAKAPSLALQDVFATFKRWLMAIYRGIQSIVGSDVLSEDMRNVMDRLLATDEAIEEARQDQGAREVIPRERFGGTDKQYAQYLKNIGRAREDAAADVQKQAIGALVADRTRWWRSEERKVRRAATIDVDSEPARRAHDWLGFGLWRHGETPDGLEPMRLSTQAITENFGEDMLARLPAALIKPDHAVLMDTAKTARAALRKKPPLRFASWVQQQGGVMDENGDVKAILGDARARPGLINNATGRSIDDMALKAWEEGFFGQGPQRELFQFAGLGAQTANLETLKTAKEMERAGKHRGFIWQHTGWARGLDGKWRFEISNADMKIKRSLVQWSRRESWSTRLDEILDWPSLFSAYPFLKDVKVRFIDPDGETAGSYWPYAKAIDVVRHRGEQLMLSTLRHEIQHAIQDHEGWPGGFNWNAVSKKSARWKKAYQILLKRGEIYREMKHGSPEPHADDIKYAEMNAAHAVYANEMGELEARDVQNRFSKRFVNPILGAENQNFQMEDIPQSERNVVPPNDMYDLLKEKDLIWRARQGDFFQGGERPTIREFLDKLAGDLKNAPAYRLADEDLVAQRDEAEQMRNWFAERGVDVMAKDADLKTQIARIAAREDASGVDPEFAASTFGFGSGEELLNALAALGSRKEAIDAEVKKRMLDAYSDPFADGSVAEEARLAAHTEAQARVIETELDAIERATGGAVRPLARAAKDVAKAQIEHMSLRQIAKYDWFLGNERRQARAAIEALEKGDYDGARLAKHRQLVNFYLYRLARDANEEMERARRYFRRLTERDGVRANIDEEYLTQIDQLLEQYELKPITQRQAERRQSLAQWAQGMEDRGLGHMVAVDPKVLARAGRTPFMHLQLDDARGLIDTVKNIEHLGRLKEKLLVAAENRAFRDVVSELADTMNATGPISPNVRANYSPTPLERTQENLRRAHAEMTRMEFLFRYLDGKHNGPLWRTLWAPFARAADSESIKMREATTRMEAIWSRYSGKERAQMFQKRISMPDMPVDTATNFTKAELLSVALNLGNQGNLEALVDGFNWSRTVQARGAQIDYEAVKREIIQALNRVFDARDWETVQMVWDEVASFREEAFQLQKDLTGLTPEAVESTPLETGAGTLRGGYYPLKYDRVRDLRVERTETKQEVQEMWGSNWFRPMTRKGHLIERVGSGGRPVKLSLTVFTEHVQNVAHDIAYRRAVIDVDRIITDPQFSETFVNVAGRPMYDQLRPWLQGIASDRIDPSAIMWQFLQKLRGNVAIATMGYRLSTALQQLAGFTQAVPMLGGPEMAAAMAKIWARPDKLYERARWITSKSEFMRSRPQTLDRDIRETIERMQTTDPLYHIRRNAFALTAAFDWAVSSTVWVAAYEKAMDGRVKGIEAGADQDAVEFADSMVRQTQSAGLPQDQPAIMRGNQVNKLLTMFMSYFSVLYNWTAFDQVMGLRKNRVPLHVFIGNMALIYVIAPLMAEALAGRFGKRRDEDDEDRNRRLAMVVAKAPFQTIPVVRDMVNMIGTGYDFQLSPAGSALNTIGQTIDRAARGELDSEYAQKNAAMAAGFAFGLPSGQAWTMIDYMNDKLEGEEQGFDPVEFAVSDRR